MARINQEEYEILKGLDDKWKWVARDKNGSLFAYLEKPPKDPYSRDWGLTGDEWFLIKEILFHFIQWEDEEPHNIQELIQEYEKYKKASDYFKVNIKNVKPEEDEEAVGITKEQVVEWIGKNEFYCHATAETVLANAVDKGELDYYGTKYSVVKKPTIPKFVAEYITYMKEEKTLVEVVYLSLEQIELGTGAVEPIDFWISRFGDKFSRAWIDGYTVEEQKYYVLDEGNIPFLSISNGEVNREPMHMTIYANGRDNAQFALTEKEIKDYDPRYMTFAKPVEEVEEEC